jgi:hypothetical protein
VCGNAQQFLAPCAQPADEHRAAADTGALIWQVSCSVQADAAAGDDVDRLLAARMVEPESPQVAARRAEHRPQFHLFSQFISMRPTHPITCKPTHAGSQAGQRLHRPRAGLTRQIKAWIRAMKEELSPD